MSVQTILLFIVSGLIFADMYITYSMYKQNEKDCTDMKYDIECLRTAINNIFSDVEGHKTHITDLKQELKYLQDEKRRPGRPKKGK